MAPNSGLSLPGQGGFNTLGQNGTAKTSKGLQTVVLQGEGVEVAGNTSLTNRARRKSISQAVLLALIDCASQREAPERVKGYWNAYYCLETIYTHEGRAYGKYCKSRFCTVCSAIRKAHLINAYYPVLKEWGEVFFLTLTIKAQPAKNLKTWLPGMIKALKQILAKLKKRHQRGKGPAIMGIRSLECNFNPQARTYNPHFHILVNSKEAAEMIKWEWVNKWRAKNCYHGAQHIRKVENLDRDLVEVIKYGTKVFTEPDPRKKKEKVPRHIYIRAMDNIIAAMVGLRVFERFGFNTDNQAKKESQVKVVWDFQEWSFSLEAGDWVETESANALTGFVIDLELRKLLQEHLEFDIE